jgi:hypothetical protein
MGIFPPENETPEEGRARRSQWPVCKGPLHELEQDETDVSPYTTFEERFAIMWQLAQQAWALRGEKAGEPELSRHIGSVVRRKR